MNDSDVKKFKTWNLIKYKKKYSQITLYDN